MGIYEYIWVYISIYGCIWVSKGIYGYTWLFMDTYGYIWVYMGSISIYMAIYWYEYVNITMQEAQNQFID